jgi:LacI family transcriptional regulator
MVSRITISDVAARAGVSISTVSRVLNGTAPVDAETAERVRSAIADLNYHPRPAARTLASNKTYTLGLLLPQIGDIYFQPLLRGIETEAQLNGYDCLIHTTQNPHSDKAIRRPLAEHNTDGLLAFTDSLDRKELQRLYEVGFPVVLLHQTPPEGIAIPVVTIENQFGARDIVAHLIEVHHRRRIVFLKGPESHEDSSWREKGYHQALKEHGIPVDPALIRSGEFNRGHAHQAVVQLLADGVAFDAIFTGDDESAVGALAALREAGRKVPEEISIVGFDDEIFASTLIPPLTTVRAPTEQVGREATRQLVRIINGESVEPRLVLPTEPVLRESCGCGPGRST